MAVVSLLGFTTIWSGIKSNNEQNQMVAEFKECKRIHEANFQKLWKGVRGALSVNNNMEYKFRTVHREMIRDNNPKYLDVFILGNKIKVDSIQRDQALSLTATLLPDHIRDYSNLERMKSAHDIFITEFPNNIFLSKSELDLESIYKEDLILLRKIK